MRIILLLLSTLLSLSALADSLTVMSWNVYFDDISDKTRYENIIKTILKTDPDIICLQEVTDQFINQLSNNRQLKKYTFNNIQGNKNYRNITLSKIKPIQSGIIKLSSNMNREAPFIKIQLNHNPLSIINLHLDSMPNDTALRIVQLKQVLQYTKNKNQLLLCGDVNFGNHDKENIFVNTMFKDAAKSDTTKTYDVDKNHLARKTKFIFEESRRLDRILTKGKITTSNYHVLILPYSDHYPIISTLSLP